MPKPHFDGRWYVPTGRVLAAGARKAFRRALCRTRCLWNDEEKQLAILLGDFGNDTKVSTIMRPESEASGTVVLGLIPLVEDVLTRFVFFVP